MFGVGNEEWWGRLWKQTGGFADRRQNWQDDTVQSSTLAQRRRGNVAPGEQFWTRYASWLVASAVRHGWRPRFRWTLLCSEQGEQQNSARTEAGREDMNTNRKGGCCNDPLDWWRKREPACVGIPSRAIDAPCMNMVMLNLNWLRVEEVSWQWSVGRVTVPRLSTWYDVTWYDMTWHDGARCDKTWHDVTWHDVTLRDMTWRDMTCYDVTWGTSRGMTWHDVTWCDMTWHDVTWRDMTWHDVT